MKDFRPYIVRVIGVAGGRARNDVLDVPERRETVFSAIILPFTKKFRETKVLLILVKTNFRGVFFHDICLRIRCTYQEAKPAAVIDPSGGRRITAGGKIKTDGRSIPAITIYPRGNCVTEGKISKEKMKDKPEQSILHQTYQKPDTSAMKKKGRNIFLVEFIHIFVASSMDDPCSFKPPAALFPTTRPLKNFSRVRH